MPKVTREFTVPERGIGRKDYSTNVARSVMPTTAGEQSPYWGVFSKTIASMEYTTVTLELGFTPTSAWVPSGQKFILTAVEISADDNSLLKLDLMREGKSNPGAYYGVGTKWGYGKAIITSDRAHYWYEDQRPVYRLSNYGDASITISTNIYGLVELVV